jgi:hypothetical protein
MAHGGETARRTDERRVQCAARGSLRGMPLACRPRAHVKYMHARAVVAARGRALAACLRAERNDAGSTIYF